METQNRCDNCAHFARHYTILNSRLIQVSYGHCKKFLGQNAIKTPKENCPHFEGAGDNSNAQNESIKKVLSKIAERLYDIALILED